MKAKVDEGGLRHEAVPLWPEVAPLAKGSDLTDQPILTIHRPSPEMNVGAACIVAPVSYTHLTLPTILLV